VQLYSIGPTFARRILKYRSLLGGYVDKEQLWEVYGMDSVRYNTIAPYVTVDPEGVAPLDLNTVSLDQLKRHPYLDYYQAKAIVLLRERVGRFESVQDLQKVPIIDNETYTKIIPYLTCNLQQNR
jgi:DNA uptake protein ComE-like DNA-binding protein